MPGLLALLPPRGQTTRGVRRSAGAYSLHCDDNNGDEGAEAVERNIRRLRASGDSVAGAARAVPQTRRLGVGALGAMEGGAQASL